MGGSHTEGWIRWLVVAKPRRHLGIGAGSSIIPRQTWHKAGEGLNRLKGFSSLGQLLRRHHQTPQRYGGQNHLPEWQTIEFLGE